LTFNNLIREEDPKACRTNIKYTVVRSEDAYWKRIESIILECKDDQPIIVFAKTKQRLIDLKKMCQRLGQQIDLVTEDQDVKIVQAVIKH
jgi:superfamily II DNA/RNA helicase